MVALAVGGALILLFIAVAAGGHAVAPTPSPTGAP
jgi:hypothetical protein